MLKSRYECQLWTVLFKDFTSKSKNKISIKLNNICDSICRINYLVLSINLSHIKIYTYLHYNLKWPWQLTSSGTSAGIFLPDNKTFKNGAIKVATSSHIIISHTFLPTFELYLGSVAYYVKMNEIKKTYDHTPHPIHFHKYIMIYGKC